MGRVLPLLGLRAFAETARRGSIKAAAEVMGVTPGAVSQQVKLLEDRLGVALFVRDSRSLHLTPEGARLHAPLVRAFDQIEQALDELARSPTREILTVSTLPSLAATWLVPRLGRFTARHPAIDVDVSATARVVDLARERIDVAVRHGLGHYPGLRVLRLMSPRLVPVGSPDLLDGGPPLTVPADCLRLPLLQDEDRADWTLWLRAHGIEDERAAHGPSFADDYLRLRAAMAGQGLALVRDVYIRDELAAGRLRLAFDLPWPTAFAYYVVMRPELADTPKVRAFVDWLREEAGDSTTPEG